MLTRQGPEPDFTTTQRVTALSALTIAYVFNNIDRMVIGTIGQSIKVDMQLNDTELGILSGFAFAILYCTLGIPIARLARRGRRVNIMAAAIAIWSGFTVACGFAQSFWQLLFLRVGVGVGEAGLSPPAYSVISDYFPARNRATALSIYALGVPVGAMLAAMIGGWIAQYYSWRAAFIVVGLPGVFIALLVKMVVKEPYGPKRENEADADASGAGRDSILMIGRSLIRDRVILHMITGCTLATLAGYGSSTYAQPYFIRYFGLSLSHVGMLFGGAVGFSCALGTLLGGVASDWAGRKSICWYALVPAIGLMIAFPLYYQVYTASRWQVALAIMILPGVFHYMFIAPSLALLQLRIAPANRASASAIFLMIVNLFAVGLGPPLCGFLIDTFSGGLFLAKGFSDFGGSCPGGVGASFLPQAVDIACKSSVALGTQRGILVLLCFFLWGAFHYLRSAWCLHKESSAAAGLATV